jgi:TonB family protein
MSPRACVIAIAAAALLPLPHARAVFAQTASPAPSLESAAVCNALVVAMDPLDAAPDHSATDYALWLGSLREQPSRVSGTVRVYVGDDRYDIAFSNAQASPVLHHDPLRMPVIVRFANPVVVSGVYLASMGDSDAKPCPILGPKPVPRGAKVAQRAADATPIAKARAAPLLAGAPTHEPRPPCGLADREARVATVAQTKWPFGELQGPTLGQATVLVVLGPAGTVLLVGIDGSTGQADFDESAMATVRRSTFSPGSFRCQAAGGIYLFVVNFAH